MWFKGEPNVTVQFQMQKFFIPGGNRAQATPGEGGLDVPEQVEGKLLGLLVRCHPLLSGCLTQSPCEGDGQIILADMLLHLQQYST